MGNTSLSALVHALSLRETQTPKPLRGWTSSRIEKQLTLDGNGQPHRETWRAIVKTAEGDAVVPIQHIHYMDPPNAKSPQAIDKN